MESEAAGFQGHEMEKIGKERIKEIDKSEGYNSVLYIHDAVKKKKKNYSKMFNLSSNYNNKYTPQLQFA